ncbi:MAG: FAD-dependent thymidylate synthase [Alphaproteobacteria bacterium]|nr:FAD-dependent thymidylate synthase [Alphaproteobacteria bacterium]
MALNDQQKAEITQQSTETFQTKRATVPALEDILFEPIKLLDHGFVRVIDYMGDDSAIVQAARVSYGKGTKKVNEDRGLINYLLRHRHTTPFEMCEIKFHIKAPIFVARQWLRHRTANVNEYSARYSIVQDEFYLPQASVLAQQSSSNRQGRDETLNPEEAKIVLDMLKQDATQVYDHYRQMINTDEEGVVQDETKPALARELARMNLTLNYYTEFYWKIDLHNLLHFLSLRADSHAQYEIQVYALAMMDVLKKWTPYSYEAFMKYHFNGAHVSQQGIEIIRQLIAGVSLEDIQTEMSPREKRELFEALDLDFQNLSKTKAA